MTMELQQEREREAAEFERRAATELPHLAEPWRSIYQARVEEMAKAVRAGSPDGNARARFELIDRIMRAVIGEASPHNARGYRLYEWVTKRDSRRSALWYPLRDFWLMPARALFPLALRIHRALVAAFGVAAIRETIAQGRESAVKPCDWIAHIELVMGIDARRTVQRELALWVADAGIESAELTQRLSIVALFEPRGSLLGTLSIARTLYSKAERRDERVERAMDLCDRAFRAYQREDTRAFSREAKRLAQRYSREWADRLGECSNIGESRCRTLDALRVVGLDAFAKGALAPKHFDQFTGRMRIGIDWIGRSNSSPFHELAAQALLEEAMRTNT